MEVTDVRIRKVTEESKMKAIVSVTFDDEFVVHDIKVIDGLNGIFVAMPSRKMADGEFRDIAHPINATTRKKIHEAVFKEYEKSLEKAENLVEEDVSQEDEVKEDVVEEEKPLEEE